MATLAEAAAAEDPRHRHTPWLRSCVDKEGLMSVRYIGSKARVADEIARLLGKWSGRGRFVDAFAGTGTVARAAADHGWPVLVNDHLVSSSAAAVAQLVAGGDVAFEALGGYEEAIAYLNRSERLQGFIWREYSPASGPRIGIERRYFTERNAALIDGIRAEIGRLSVEGGISEVEQRLLIADLIAATNRVANIAGTYGCFLRYWSANAQRDLQLVPRSLRQEQVAFEVRSVDVFDLATRSEDTAYLDPPYTKRQYAAYYHVCETIADGDAPVVTGVTGLRPWEHKASPFCYKTRALRALVDLISKLDAHRVLLSYSNEGHVPLAALKASLADVGVVSEHSLATIGRYRPNERASANAAAVREFLLEVHRTPHQREAVPARRAVAV